MKFTNETAALITGHVDRPIHRFCRWDGKQDREILEEDIDRRAAISQRLDRIEADVRDLHSQVAKLGASHAERA